MKARYRMILTSIWGDPSFLALRNDAKLVWFSLHTHPAMTPVGAMRGTVAGLAEELHWKAGPFGKAVADLVRAGLVELNAQASFIALPDFLVHEPPVNPNAVRKLWVRALIELPECPERVAVARRVVAHLKDRPEALLQHLPETLIAEFEKLAGLDMPSGRGGTIP